jgi:hypothetical protein
MMNIITVKDDDHLLGVCLKHMERSGRSLTEGSIPVFA